MLNLTDKHGIIVSESLRLYKKTLVKKGKQNNYEITTFNEPYQKGCR